jgi:hypothetical protein
MVGFLVSIYGEFSLLSRLPAGALLSGRTAPAFAAGAGVLLALSTAAYGIVTDLAVLTIVRAVNGFAYGGVTAVNMALRWCGPAAAASSDPWPTVESKKVLARRWICRIAAAPARGQSEVPCLRAW